MTAKLSAWKIMCDFEQAGLSIDPSTFSCEVAAALRHTLLTMMKLFKLFSTVKKAACSLLLN